MRRFFGRIGHKLANMNRLILFLAGLLVFMGYMVLAYVGIWPKGRQWAVQEYIDLHLLLWLLLLFVFVMCVTGIWKEFINGFRLAFSKGRNITRMELQKAAKAMETARKVVVLESVIAVSSYMVDLLYNMAEP